MGIVALLERNQTMMLGVRRQPSSVANLNYGKAEPPYVAMTWYDDTSPMMDVQVNYEHYAVEAETLRHSCGRPSEWLELKEVVNN